MSLLSKAPALNPFTLALVQLGQIGSNKTENLKHARDMVLKAAAGKDGKKPKPRKNDKSIMGKDSKSTKPTRSKKDRTPKADKADIPSKSRKPASTVNFIDPGMLRWQVWDVKPAKIPDVPMPVRPRDTWRA